MKRLSHMYFPRSPPLSSSLALSVSIFCVYAAAACTTDAQCSFNGVCSSGACVCDAAWRSSPGVPFGCSVLNLLNPVRGAGLHTVDSGRNMSSWGGSALRDERTGTYHMFASQMVNHCGIACWTENSHVVRATSATADGTYERVAESGGEVFPVFSHEPNAVRDPSTGEWALFFTMKSPSGRRVCNCSDGSSLPGCGSGGGEGPTVVSWAPAPEGPWSPPLKLLDMGGREPDTNLAPVILPNGSLVGIWRTWGDSSCPHVHGGSCPHLVTASHWKNASTYVFRSDALFPELGTRGSEDPALYLDAHGRFHALFHNMDPCPDYPCPEVAGGHAFSADGVVWIYTGVAYNSTGYYTDGTRFSFGRRERPHPVMAADGYTIVALTTGVNYADKSTAHGDATFTFLQPVAA